MTQFGTLLEASGIVVWLLVAISIVALAIIILKQWQFLDLRPESNDSIRQALEVLRTQDAEQARSLLEEKPCFGSEIVAFAIDEARLPTPTSAGDVKRIEDEFERLGAQKLRELRSFLPVLEAIGTLSPLLGLLGTVLGMIDAFQAMELAGNEVDPSTLSGGIWQALLTTAMGLIVAIPSLAIHNWMDRKVQRVAENLDDALGQVLNFRR